MASRPRHEALRGHITELLRSGVGASYEDIAHEVYLLDNSGRIDTLWGATVIELKSDLRRELDDVLARMPAYLADAAARSRSTRPVTGLATDGATFIAYALQGAALLELARYATDPERPDELMAWLEPLLSECPDLLPEPRAVAKAFGRGSLTFARARVALDALWIALRADPEVRLKRELWDGLLREAYGEEVGGDALFVQHTYLTAVVKVIAARVLDLPVDDPASLLSGQALADEGILGAVEADFFDWPLKTQDGAELVRQIALQVARFRLRDVEADVLKILYESLVDPNERHDLGEYYTPDWLAGRVVAAAVYDPLGSRVLDPACGSGTFLFHIDADTKLIPSYYVGARDAEAAQAFIGDLASRLANRVQLTSDGHKPYLDAVEQSFGADIDYAMLIKICGDTPGQGRYSPGECTGAVKRRVEGKPAPEHISTSYAERNNLTLRMGSRRFTRLTNAFSKKVENHAHSVAIHTMHYDFVRIHQTLRVTPAMAAGVTAHLRELADMVKVLEEWEAAKGAAHQ